MEEFKELFKETFKLIGHVILLMGLLAVVFAAVKR
jgi:hypothetical protein